MPLYRQGVKWALLLFSCFDFCPTAALAGQLYVDTVRQTRTQTRRQTRRHQGDRLGDKQGDRKGDRLGDRQGES